MPAKDIYHETVKTALVKEGWIIPTILFIDSVGEKTYLSI
ncbi:MAG: element excision factor XisH family protein [Cyanobacteriota bacterium]|nr:element excision factor XisH family protein [Cyanobacteriota bacterium]